MLLESVGVKRECKCRELYVYIQKLRLSYMKGRCNHNVIISCLEFREADTLAPV